MTPDTLRPQVSVIGDRVHIFIGGAHHALPLAAAESLESQLADAIAKLKQQEADKV
jgi:hypothetical protein